MKILWVKGTFLHPAISGGRVVSLEILRRLHQRHEVHFAAYLNAEDEFEPSREYCSFSYPIQPPVFPDNLRPFALQVLREWFWRLPADARVCSSAAMQRQIRKLLTEERFDAVIFDGPQVAANPRVFRDCILLEYAVESVLLHQRQHLATKALIRLQLTIQAHRMSQLESRLCREGKRVITISEADAQSIRDLYHTERVSHVTPGVDAHYFCKPPSAPHRGNFVFVGALSWNANVDGIVWFVREILPKIRSRYPDCTLSIVGGSPPPEVLKFAQEDKGIEVTGRVPDIRPWLWGSDISILPIRIGGGVRIKLYESMAAGTPAVSTSIGAQGLDVTPGENILIADTAQDFADKCIGLLGDAEERRRIAHVASEMVRTRYSWEQTVEQLEAILAKSALGN